MLEVANLQVGPILLNFYHGIPDKFFFSSCCECLKNVLEALWYSVLLLKNN